MEKVNACIFSVYMDNINPQAVQAQKLVVDKFNKSKVPFYQLKTNGRHADAIDAFWHMNGIQFRDDMKHMEKRWNHDVILFLDIDCLPLNDFAIDDYLQQAQEGHLVGNIQRSNHIQNNQHVFAAPSAMAISANTFLTIGKPSARETYRGDVCEEYTYQLEQRGYKPVLALPLRYDGKPLPQGGQVVDAWNLADGMPKYGLGTTFGMGEVETFWHGFQAFLPGQHEKFMAKCHSLTRPEPVLNEPFTLTVV